VLGGSVHHGIQNIQYPAIVQRNPPRTPHSPKAEVQKAICKWGAFVRFLLRLRVQAQRRRWLHHDGDGFRAHASQSRRIAKHASLNVRGQSAPISGVHPEDGGAAHEHRGAIISLNRL
jgi:hypothetical protein